VVSEVVDFESTIRFPKIQYGGKKLEKTLDFHKSEYTRVFGFAVKNYTRKFSKSLIPNPQVFKIQYGGFNMAEKNRKKL